MTEIPHELLRSIPRDVRLTATGRFIVALAMLLLAAALSVGPLLFVIADRARAIAAQAMLTRGEITALETTRGDHPRWVADYAYEAGGRTLYGQGRLGRRDRERRAVGDPLDVYYVPNDPATNWVAGHQPRRLPFALPPIVSVSLGSLGVLVMFVVRRETSLLATGRPVVATVVRTRRVAYSHGSSTQRVVFEFRALSGATITASIDTQRRVPNVGAKLVIVYDPDTPTRVSRYPMSLCYTRPL